MHPPLSDTLPLELQNSGFDFPTDFGYEFPSIYEAMNAWVPETTTTQSAFSFLPPGQPLSENAPFTTASLDLARRVQETWPRRRASAVVRVIRNMWCRAAQHNTNNLFSNTQSKPLAGKTRPRWNMDEDCRERLMSDCDTLLLPAERYSERTTAPGSRQVSVPLEQDVEVEGLSPQSPRLNFPSTETLDMSIGFYFRRFHPVFPFIHQATFDAKSTPSTLLFPMCLIGLSILNPGGAESFLRLYLGKLLRFCRLDLTYKGLGKGGAQQLVTSLASSLLVLYLCLSCEQIVDIHQAHMLAIQTLFIADRHGMFSAHEGEALSQNVFQDLEQEALWMAWARVESLKRLVVCLISIDSAYTRLLDLAANIGIDRVEVVLPCDEALFEAPSASVFFRRLEQGTPMIASQVDLCEPQLEILSDLDFYGMKALLDVLALREAAARHKMLSYGTSPFRTVSFVPALVYANHNKAFSIAKDLVSIANTRQVVLNHNAPAALSWNYLCLMLTADLDRIQTACGRTGLEGWRRASTELIQWSKTASSRRAVVHAAQIFRILSQQRVSDYKILLYEMMLANAALVVAVHVLAFMDMSQAQTDDFELLQNCDWAEIQSEGLIDLPLAANLSATPTFPAKSAAWRFITQGGPFTFGGETYISGGGCARKVVLNYAQLLDEIATQNESEYSQLLRTIGDFLGAVENNSLQ